MATAPAIVWNFGFAPEDQHLPDVHQKPNQPKILEFSGVFRGRELTRKDARLSSRVRALDNLLAGGIPRGRISEVVGPAGSGKTAIAASFAASTTNRGEVAAWIDLPNAFDPAAIESAGADLGRILWAFSDGAGAIKRAGDSTRNALKASETILGAGGFGLLVIDFGAMRYPLTQSAALRLARAAERSGTAVITMGTYRMFGTFAAITLGLGRPRPCFDRVAPKSPALFDGLRIEAVVIRNKLGGQGRRAELFAGAAHETLRSPEFLAAPTPSEKHADGTPTKNSDDALPSVGSRKFAINFQR